MGSTRKVYTVEEAKSELKMLNDTISLLTVNADLYKKYPQEKEKEIKSIEVLLNNITGASIKEEMDSKEHGITVGRINAKIKKTRQFFEEQKLELQQKILELQTKDEKKEETGKQAKTLLKYRQEKSLSILPTYTQALKDKPFEGVNLKIIGSNSGQFSGYIKPTLELEREIKDKMQLLDLIYQKYRTPSSLVSENEIKMIKNILDGGSAIDKEKIEKFRNNELQLNEAYSSLYRILFRIVPHYMLDKNILNSGNFYAIVDHYADVFSKHECFNTNAIQQHDKDKNFLLIKVTQSDQVNIFKWMVSVNKLKEKVDYRKLHLKFYEYRQYLREYLDTVKPSTKKISSPLIPIGQDRGPTSPRGEVSPTLSSPQATSPKIFGSTLASPTLFSNRKQSSFLTLRDDDESLLESTRSSVPIESVTVMESQSAPVFYSKVQIEKNKSSLSGVYDEISGTAKKNLENELFESRRKIYTEYITKIIELIEERMKGISSMKITPEIKLEQAFYTEFFKELHGSQSQRDEKSKKYPYTAWVDLKKDSRFKQVRSKEFEALDNKMLHAGSWPTRPVIKPQALQIPTTFDETSVLNKIVLKLKEMKEKSYLTDAARKELEQKFYDKLLDSYVHDPSNATIREHWDKLMESAQFKGGKLESGTSYKRLYREVQRSDEFLKSQQSTSTITSPRSKSPR